MLFFFITPQGLSVWFVSEMALSGLLEMSMRR